MKENVIKDKSYGFALRVIKAYRFLSEDKREFYIVKTTKETHGSKK